MSATEQQVRLASQLYDARRAARTLLGDKYAPTMAELGGLLDQVVADHKAPSQMQAAILLARKASDDGRGVAAIYFLAAAVEQVEPTPVPA